MDQLIICSIYASCKGVYKIMFNDIKECYMMSNPNLKDIIEDIIVHVYMSEEEPPNDIITFYNQMFLKFDKLKDFISNLRSNSSSTTALNNVASKNNKKNTLLMSPMKAIIPKDIPFKSKTNAVNNANVKGKNNNMTPQTQLLFAYNESPILKYEVNTFKGPLKSKKVLHYEDEEEKMKNRSYEEEMPIYSNKPTPSDNNISPHMNMNNYQATNDYITKKCKILINHRCPKNNYASPATRHDPAYSMHPDHATHIPAPNAASNPSTEHYKRKYQRASLIELSPDPIRR